MGASVEDEKSVDTEVAVEAVAACETFDSSVVGRPAKAKCNCLAFCWNIC